MSEETKIGPDIRYIFRYKSGMYLVFNKDGSRVYAGSADITGATKFNSVTEALAALQKGAALSGATSVGTRLVRLIPVPSYTYVEEAL